MGVRKWEAGFEMSRLCAWWKHYGEAHSHVQLTLFVTWRIFFIIIVVSLIFYFMSMGVLAVLMSVHEKRVLSPLELELQMIMSCSVGAGNCPGPLREQPVLLTTEPPLQPFT